MRSFLFDNVKSLIYPVRFIMKNDKTGTTAVLMNTMSRINRRAAGVVANVT